MKKLLFVFLVAATIPAVGLAQNTSAYQEVTAFLQEKDYFRARDLYNKNAKEMQQEERLVLDAYINNAFNRPALSNNAIASFLKTYSKQVSDSLRLELLRLKQSNHVRLFEYAAALKAGRELLDKYSERLSAAELADYKNTAVIWKALLGSPGQVVTIAENTVIKMSRDKANLANLPVKANGTVAGFIFDTGANFSTVTETTARSFNMKLLEGFVDVGSITGAKVRSRIAICPSFSMGNIRVRNAVFLVFPDTALAFPQIQYQINGIIGFPVIEALKEVQLTRSDEFRVPKQQSLSPVQNLALEFLTPIFDLDGEYFSFDTGATGTMLYSKYFKKYEKQIKSQYTEADLQFGGAGGMLTKKGYKITYSPVVNSKKLNLTDVHVFRDSVKEEKDYFYGNIGQDVIKQFEKMVLNFSSMFIRFE